VPAFQEAGSTALLPICMVMFLLLLLHISLYLTPRLQPPCQEAGNISARLLTKRPLTRFLAPGLIEFACPATPGLPQLATAPPSPCVLCRLLGTPLGMARIGSEPGKCSLVSAIVQPGQHWTTTGALLK
jgi:hypothetical protein